MANFTPEDLKRLELYNTWQLLDGEICEKYFARRIKVTGSKKKKKIILDSLYDQEREEHARLYEAYRLQYDAI